MSVKIALTASLLAASVLGAGNLDALRNFKLDNGVITSVEYSDAPTLEIAGREPIGNVRPRTIVKAVLTPAPGSRINISVCLPEPKAWNGRFLGLGNGGGAGSIGADFFVWPLSAGYACATTDMGTAPDPQTSGVRNPEVWKDFGFRATHLMTVAAKEIIREYYGKAPEYSYFSGGSTGGQQAIQEAQRYPEDYDGIFARVPAHCRTPLHAYFLWNHQILKKCPFSAEQEGNVLAAARRYLADRQPPSASGKVICDPRVSADDIENVIRLARELDPSLTDAHAEALRKIFDGPRHEVTGEQIFKGVPLGARFTSAQGHFYLFNWVFPGKKLESINFGSDYDAYTAALGPQLNAENADLRPFEARGGKLLIVSGFADEIVPYTATLDYYERLIGYCGGSQERVKAFCRMYLVPAMNHGGIPGGSVPLGIGTVVDWREKGMAPETVQITGPDFKLAIDPYPAAPTEIKK